MRNDVKLGFAIGGVLLAVLVVYVLVVPGAHPRVAVAPSSGDKDSGAKVKLEPMNPAKPLAQVPPAGAPPQVFTPGGAGDKAAPSAGGAVAEKSSTPTDSSVEGAKTPAKGASAETGKTVASAQPAGPDWDRILNDQPTLIGQTPVDVSSANPSIPAETAPKVQPASPPIEQLPQRVNSDMAPEQPASAQTAPREGQAPIAGAISTDPPGPNGGHIHTVAMGETFSSISNAAYGSPNYYPAIMRANPNIDPQHLRPGMKITLPDASQVKSPASSAVTANDAGGSAHLVSTTIDPTKQYRVQPGDSLYRIAVKLYGKGTYSAKLFELNQQVMGGDETRLRPGQILNLPEPPTQGQ